MTVLKGLKVQRSSSAARSVADDSARRPTSSWEPRAVEPGLPQAIRVRYGA